MATITLQTPDKYKTFLEESSEFESIITEVMYDYVEKKQDQIIKDSLNNNSYFHKLNKSLESKLWR